MPTGTSNVESVWLMHGQVELLLTLEEFCSEEGAFEGTQEGGRHFTAIFSKARPAQLWLLLCQHIPHMT